MNNPHPGVGYCAAGELNLPVTREASAELLRLCGVGSPAAPIPRVLHEHPGHVRPAVAHLIRPGGPQPYPRGAAVSARRDLGWNRREFRALLCQRNEGRTLHL